MAGEETDEDKLRKAEEEKAEELKAQKEEAKDGGVTQMEVDEGDYTSAFFTDE